MYMMGTTGAHLAAAARSQCIRQGWRALHSRKAGPGLLKEVKPEEVQPAWAHHTRPQARHLCALSGRPIRSQNLSSAGSGGRDKRIPQPFYAPTEAFLLWLASGTCRQLTYMPRAHVHALRQPARTRRVAAAESASAGASNRSRIRLVWSPGNLLVTVLKDI